MADPVDHIEGIVRAVSAEQLFELVMETATPVVQQALFNIYKRGWTLEAAAEAANLSWKQLRSRIDLWVRQQQRLGRLDPSDFCC